MVYPLLSTHKVHCSFLLAVVAENIPLRVGALFGLALIAGNISLTSPFRDAASGAGQEAQGLIISSLELCGGTCASYTGEFDAGDRAAPPRQRHHGEFLAGANGKEVDVPALFPVRPEVIGGWSGWKDVIG